MWVCIYCIYYKWLRYKEGEWNVSGRDLELECAIIHTQEHDFDGILSGTTV